LTGFPSLLDHFFTLEKICVYSGGKGMIMRFKVLSWWGLNQRVENSVPIWGLRWNVFPETRSLSV